MGLGTGLMSGVLLGFWRQEEREGRGVARPWWWPPAGCQRVAAPEPFLRDLPWRPGGGHSSRSEEAQKDVKRSGGHVIRTKNRLRSTFQVATVKCISSMRIIFEILLFEVKLRIYTLSHLTTTVPDDSHWQDR